MTKKTISIAAVFAFLAALITGCALTSVTDSLTSADTTADGMAKGGTMIMVGVSSVSSAVEGTGSAADVQISSIKAMSGDMPAAFKTTTLGADGYVLVEDNVTGGGKPYVRMITKGGSIVNSTYLSGKTLAEGIEWDDFFTMNGPPDEEMRNAISEFIATSNKTYSPITTLSNYMAWLFIAGELSEHNNGVAFSNPAAGVNDGIGSMQCKVVFGDIQNSSIKKASTTVSGEVTFSITVEENGGKPVDGTYTGSGSITIVSISTTINFAVITSVTFSGGEAVSLIIDGTESNGYTLHLEAVPSQKTGSFYGFH